MQQPRLAVLRTGQPRVCGVSVVTFGFASLGYDAGVPPGAQAI